MRAKVGVCCLEATRTERLRPSSEIAPRAFHVRCSTRRPSVRHHSVGRLSRCWNVSSPLVTAPAQDDACGGHVFPRARFSALTQKRGPTAHPRVRVRQIREVQCRAGNPLVLCCPLHGGLTDQRARHRSRACRRAPFGLPPHLRTTRGRSPASRASRLSRSRACCCCSARRAAPRARAAPDTLRWPPCWLAGHHVAPRTGPQAPPCTCCLAAARLAGWNARAGARSRSARERWPSVPGGCDAARRVRACCCSRSPASSSLRVAGAPSGSHSHARMRAVRTRMLASPYRVDLQRAPKRGPRSACNCPQDLCVRSFFFCC